MGSNYIERPAVIRDIIVRPVVIRDQIVRNSTIRDLVIGIEAKVRMDDVAAPASNAWLWEDGTEMWWEDGSEILTEEI